MHMTLVPNGVMCYGIGFGVKGASNLGYTISNKFALLGA